MKMDPLYETVVVAVDCIQKAIILSQSHRRQISVEAVINVNDGHRLDVPFYDVVVVTSREKMLSVRRLLENVHRTAVAL